MNHCYFSFTNASYANSAPSDQNLASFSFIMFPFPAAATFQLQMTTVPQSKAQKRELWCHTAGARGEERREGLMSVAPACGMSQYRYPESRASCMCCK